MHSRSFFVAFLTLALSSFAAQAAPASNHDQSECSSAQVQTVYQTVTVTASSAASTSSSSSNSNQSGSNNQSNGSNNNQSNGSNNNQSNGSNNNQSNGSSSSTSSSSNNKGNSGHQTNVNNDNNNNNGKNNNGKNNNGKNNNGKNNTNNNNNNNNASSTTTASAATNTNNASNSGNSTGVDAAQTSLTLDPRVIAKGFENNGQDVPAAGQVPSLTSSNNFINFCLTVPNLPITDGKQVTTGSCNPAPIGVIPSTDNMPSAKFSSPQNFATLKANTPFTIEMNIQGMETGFFVNADENYFAAPQQLNAQGQIKGHSHVVIEQLNSLEQATPTDPRKFAFFKGLNSAAVNGKLNADVSAGLPAGVYRLASINTNANHAPAIVPVAQHGSLDDAIYFTVTADGNPSAGASSSAASSVAASSTASAGSANASASASASASKIASASKTASASKNASASVTGTAEATASATKVSSFVVASSTAKVSLTDKASSTVEASASASASKAASSAAVPTATDKAATEAPPKAARDLRFRRRWNIRK